VIRNATTSEAQSQTLVLGVVRRPGEASGTEARLTRSPAFVTLTFTGTF